MSSPSAPARRRRTICPAYASYSSAESSAIRFSPIGSHSS